MGSRGGSRLPWIGASVTCIGVGPTDSHRFAVRKADQHAGKLADMPKRTIEKVVVLGAGTMGARIAAHVANAGVWCALLDIAPAELTSEEQRRGLALTR